MTKAAALAKSGTTTKGQTLKIVREAMDVQEERFKQMMEAKDDQIVRQQELLIAQKKQLQEREKLKQDPNVIQITELQKLAGMETADKYAVLEFLVKELMGMRKDDLLKQGDLFRTANAKY